MVSYSDLYEKITKAIYNNNYEKTKQLLEKARKKNEILKLKPIYVLEAFKLNNVKLVKLLMDYANENNFTLDINFKNTNEEFPLLFVAKNKNIEMLTLLFDYASENNIILNINEKYKYKTPFYFIIEEYNSEMILVFIEYAKEKNIILEKGDCGLLLKNTNGNNIIVSSLVNYSIETGNELPINLYYITPFLIKKKYDIFKSLLYYFRKTDKKLSMNDMEIIFLKVVETNNVEIVKFMLSFINDINLILNINATVDSDYPLLVAIQHNNIQIFRLLFDYANENNILMDINKKNKSGLYPIGLASKNNNIEIVKFLKNYANEHKILLKYDIFDLSSETYNILNEKVIINYNIIVEENRIE